MRIPTIAAFAMVLCVPALLAIACAESVDRSAGFEEKQPGPSAEAGVEAPPTFTGDANAPRCNPCDDFPADPILDGDVPPNVASLFGPPGSGNPINGPCLIEPEIGTLFPNNWLRPRFRFVNIDSQQQLFEIRLHSDYEKNDLVVYTSKSAWTLPKAIWTAISQNLVDQPITMTMRGFDPNSKNVYVGSSGPFRIAPAGASGSIVYWTPTGGSALRGFAVGDEGVVDVLRPSQTGSQCIGCHSSTPDGQFVAFAESDIPDDGDPAGVELRSADGTAKPAAFSPVAIQLLNRKPQHAPQFSKAHWTPGDRIAITMKGGQILWTDLETTSDAQGAGWGIFERQGDSDSVSYPTISHDGTKIVYSSNRSSPDGKPNYGDIVTVPYNARKGGAVAPVAGANSAAFNEYFPSFSADDALIAYTRVGAGQTFNNNPEAEVLVVSAAGGTSARLAANDPPACGSRRSPGVTNSWPKWSPAATVVGSKIYYWLTFSSTRADGNPQLYVTAVTVEGGAITTYPALYLWNQPAGENNHTPAWDVFELPPSTPK